MVESMVRVPLDWVKGPEEVTVWMWPNDPDPVTVRFEIEEWERIREAAGEQDLEKFIGETLVEDLGHD